jgi:uncharacterized protein YjiS (DUF1127 family)
MSPNTHNWGEPLRPLRGDRILPSASKLPQSRPGIARELVNRASRVVRAFHRWRRRARDRAALAALDDRMLDDIGLTRIDVVMWDQQAVTDSMIGNRSAPRISLSRPRYNPANKVLTMTQETTLAAEPRIIGLTAEPPQPLGSRRRGAPQHLACHWRKAADGTLVGVWTTVDQMPSNRRYFAPVLARRFDRQIINRLVDRLNNLFQPW